MPYPRNVETALRVEGIVREAGAVPATIAVLGGRLKAGLSGAQIEALGRPAAGVVKASRRDLPRLVATGGDGATTVAATMILAAMAGIRVFATGGIGGVHRGAERSWDVSADLEELARTEVAVVCAGAKSILDLPKTLEYLETKGVPVIGYGTDEFPAFYTSSLGPLPRREGGHPRPRRRPAQGEVGPRSRRRSRHRQSPAEELSMDSQAIGAAIEKALEAATVAGIKGKDVTPFSSQKLKSSQAARASRRISPSC